MVNNIREYRKRLGLSQSALGELIGLTGLSVYRHEKSQRSLDQPMLNKYAKVFGCTPADIIAEDTIQKPQQPAEIDESILLQAINAYFDFCEFLPKNKDFTREEMAHILFLSYKKFSEEKTQLKGDQVTQLKDVKKLID